MSSEVVPTDPAAQQEAFLRQYESGEKPAVFDDSRGVAAFVSYVWFKTTNDELKEEIKAAGGVLPTFTLTRAGFREPIKPFRYHLFDMRVIATKNDNSGRIIDAEPDMPNLPKDELKSWSEHAFAVVGVVKDSLIVPALVNLRGGARRALLHAATATKDAAGPNWGRRGQRFMETIPADQRPSAHNRIEAEVWGKYDQTTGTRLFPGRVISTGSVRPEKNEKSGHYMLVGQCSWSPSTTEDLSRFNAAVSDPQFFRDLEAARNFHLRKLKGLLSKEMSEAVDE